MRLEILHLYLITDRRIEETPTQLRGYIGQEFFKFSEFHHHLNLQEGVKLMYEYPKIQYKVNKNAAIILAIGANNVALLKKIVMNVKKLLLGQNTYSILEIKAHYDDAEFGITEDSSILTYQFITPWIALNKKNYNLFKNSSIEEGRALLRRILIGNILSVSKYLEYTVPRELKTEVNLFPVKAIYKNVPMIGFKGKFELNFIIPNYLGLGKAVSHGYGTVNRLNSESERLN